MRSKAFSVSVSASFFLSFFFFFQFAITISEFTQSLQSLFHFSDPDVYLLIIHRVSMLFISLFVIMNTLLMTASFIAIAAATQSFYRLLKASKHCPNEISHLQAGLSEL